VTIMPTYSTLTLNATLKSFRELTSGMLLQNL
jgi:hypothetical protein